MPLKWGGLERLFGEIGLLLRNNPRVDTDGILLIERALILAEDRRYDSHYGVDPVSVFRAVVFRFWRGHISGASTIEQQLVRTLRGRYERTYRRKFSEMLLAILVARRFSKRECAWAYLLVAYFGWEAKGLLRATDRLRIDLSQVSIENAATLASMLKMPMPKEPSDAYSARLARRVSYVVRLLKIDRERSSVTVIDPVRRASVPRS
jgi:membrane peptidoglycan carboxypeptidase